ncbi:uncharacterized protein LOC143183426 [Calliopsis andreniformis]|uniref:uncharacterized protein LOC143183426 n=1 Tax=Calliopsis andreniformis TaxID=337506 RepID=UPI003FCE0D83
MIIYFEILCGVVALLLALYYYNKSTYDFWTKRGVRGPQPLPFLGNTKDIMLAKVPVAVYLKELYDKYQNEPMIGLYMKQNPVLVLNDADFIKDVLIRDFSKFADRGFNVHEKTEPLSPHLFNLEAERWRPLRSKLSPIFTSGKLKDMFPLIIECSKSLEKYLDKVVAKEEPAEVRELTARFTTDVIGSCAFGIDMNALSEEDSEFRRVGRKVFAVNLENILRFKMKQYMPKIYDLLGYIVPENKYSPFFTKIVRDTIKYRKEHNISRPDFINMLIQLQEHPEKLSNIELTDSLLTAQAFVFFAAGFETSSSTMSNALYELARNQEVQNKLREEIREYFAKNNGELKYDEIKEMKYLDKVFRETLRKYPAGPMLLRKATSDYTFEGTNITIPKGTMIWIPIFAIHRDSQVYPNPDVFDPERFSDEAIATRHPMHYLPFGDGPRNCIGARFAVSQTKVGLITILRNHKVDVCDKTMIPYEFHPGAFLLAPKRGIYLRITKRLLTTNMADYFQLLGGIALVFFALYYYFTSTFDFWKSRGVPGPEPIVALGNAKDSLLKKLHTGVILKNIYNEYKNEPVIGIFMSRKPVLVVRDLDLVKDVLIKDFSVFDDRGNNIPQKMEPLSLNIFNFEPERWRPLRMKLSPVFTSGKLKEMFPLIVECANQLEKYLEQVVEKNEPREVREIAAKYTIDVIGSCAFGINMNALSNEESEFRRMGREAFSTHPLRLLKLTIRELAPGLFNLLGYVLPRTKITKFFTRVISETINYREQNNIVRPDFVNILMELKKHPDKLPNLELTDSILAAQAFLFFAAGFETSSTTIGHALYEMALNPDMQDKLRQEIKESFVKTNGEFKYEDVKQMRYLDKVFKETLRKYPPGTALQRKCNRNYTFNGTKVSIPKNTTVFIPVYAIHFDPNIYPNPEVFDPERFNDEAVAARHPISFLPFGNGPRNCIGARFAVYQTKIGLIKMLKNFRVDVCEKTIIPYESDPKSLILGPKGGIYLRINKLF